MLKKTFHFAAMIICAFMLCTSAASATEVEEFSDEWYAQKFGKYGFHSGEEYRGNVDLLEKFEDKTVPDVRVNGHIVDFPDAQPYVDDNNRTLIPVRFVVEQMGANVSWDQATQTASIQKNGITVKITVGQQTLKVIKTGVTESVVMDTVAVVKNSRTYVPIRFVAEALGAYVDFSTTCKTVGIYNDVLTKEQIEFLLSLDYADPEQFNSSLTYTNLVNRNEDPAYIAERYGTDRETFQGNFANAREHVYRSTGYWTIGDYKFVESGIMLPRIDVNADTFRTTAEFVDAAIEEVRATYEYDCEFYRTEVFTDASCVYQGDVSNGSLMVRAIVKYTPKICNPMRLFFSDEDLDHLNQLPLWDNTTMDPQYMVIDVLVDNPTVVTYAYACWGALPQTPNLSRDICKQLGFEGGSELRWSEESNYLHFVPDTISIASTSVRHSDGNHIAKVNNKDFYYAIVSDRTIWTHTNGWKTVDMLEYSKEMIRSDFDLEPLVSPVKYHAQTPTQYRKLVSPTGAVSYQFGQWQSKYVYGSDEWKAFDEVYGIVKHFRGSSSVTLEVLKNGEWKRITYYAKDYPSLDELKAEYLNSWAFVPGAYVQNSSGQWAFQTL